MNSFLKFFVLEFIAYLLVCTNMRAIAAGSYLWTLSSDSIITLNGFYIMRVFMREPDNKVAVAGAMLGGMLGSALALFITKRQLH